MTRALLLCLALAWPSLGFAQVVDLQVAGDDTRLTNALRQEALTISVLAEENSNTQDVVASARADYRRLLTALYAAGYYGGSVSIRIDGREASNLEPLFAPSIIRRVDITINPGPAFRFGTIDIGPMSPDTQLPEALQTGNVAESGLIRSGASAAVDAWRSAGHATAAVASQSITAQHIERQLDVAIAISPGPRLSFGTVSITGNENVRSGAIRRIAGLPVGETFSPAELDKAAQRLRQTGAFAGVATLEGEVSSTATDLPITIQVQETLPRRFGFGFELSSVEGMKLSSFWMHRNAAGGAERFRVDGEIAGIGGETGGIDYSLATSLNIPAIYGPDTSLLTTFEISRDDEPDYLLDQLSFETTATRVISDNLTTQAGLGLLTAREETDDGIRRYSAFTLPLGVEFDQRDDETNTKNGYFIDTNLTPFFGIQGTGTGARFFTDLRGFRSFGSEQTLTIAARAQAGSVIGASISETPADFLFYSGGGGTVRGQEYHDLGVSNGTTTTGGSSFIGAQVEARFDVTDKIGLVGFYDFGHIGSTSSPGRNGRSHDGTGFGLRYNTGFGPIRFDIGTPATGDDAFDSVQIYLGIGQAF